MSQGSTMFAKHALVLVNLTTYMADHDVVIFAFNSINYCLSFCENVSENLENR